MKKSLLTIIILFFFISSLKTQQYSANDWIETIDVSKWSDYNIDVESYLKEAKRSSKLFEILIIREYSTTNAYNIILRDFSNEYDSLKQNSKISIPDLRNICLPQFNIQKYGVRIIQPSAVTTARCNFVLNDKKISSSGRSNIILSMKTDDSLLVNNINELDLVRKRISNDMTYYEFGGIKSEEDFCWKLQQLIYFLNELPEPQKKLNKLARSPTQIDLGFSSKLAESVQTKIYNTSYDGMRYSVEAFNAFQVTLLKRINNPAITTKDLSKINTVKKITKYNPLRISVGIQYSYSKQLMAGNLSSFTDQMINQGSSNSIHQLNIYGQDIKERFVISNHRIGGELRVEKEKNTNYNEGIKYSSFGFSFIPYTIIGSYYDAEIVSGSFSYKGKIEGVAGEIENIESLGLQNNIPLNKSRSSSELFSGLGATLRLFYSFGNDKVGFCLFPYFSIESLKNKNEQSADYVMTKNVNDYSPSLLNLQRIQTTSFGLGFSLQFPIGL